MKIPKGKITTAVLNRTENKQKLYKILNNENATVKDKEIALKSEIINILSNCEEKDTADIKRTLQIFRQLNHSGLIGTVATFLYDLNTTTNKNAKGYISYK